MELLLYAHENDPDCVRVISGCKSNQLIELLCSKLWDLLRVYRLKSSALPDAPRRRFDSTAKSCRPWAGATQNVPHS